MDDTLYDTLLGFSIRVRNPLLVGIGGGFLGRSVATVSYRMLNMSPCVAPRVPVGP